MLKIKWLLLNKKLVFTIIIAILLISFKTDSALQKFRLTGFAQGTTWQITYYAKDSLISIDQVEQIFAEIDSSMSLYKPFSVINQFNASVKGVKIDKHLKRVIVRSKIVSEETNGIFDITVKPLVEAWGFGVNSQNTNPNKKEIEEILNCVGNHQIILKGDSLIKTKPCVQIDVNGIAQGYTVDLIANYLETKSIRNYMVEVGGEIMVKGKKSDGNHFTIGIESPDDVLDLPFKQIISLKSGAITTSGIYRKFKMQGSKKLSHLIDAKTGYPIDNEMISVTVWAKDAILADAYDHVFMNMGITKSFEFLKNKKDMEVYFIYIDKSGNVADTSTTGFRGFFKKEGELIYE
jgi:thiamine biosynthesis lipoprotein